MKLYVCFFWHMHQPYYKDPETGTYILPWVRLHAIKDYAALPRIFRRVPGVRHTFNLVPSLLIQVKDYVDNGAEDIFLTVSRKNALDLTKDEERFLLRNFFSAFPPTMIIPQARYAELFYRREEARRALENHGAPGEFGASEYTDLVTLFNLVWFHPLHREEDPELTRLWQKGRGFTEKEKHYVLDRQRDIMATVIPEYRRLAEKDGGELSCSPMYHPILPLLIDNQAAERALPGAPLPKLPFRYPEDALGQLLRGRESFRAHFGRDPDGLWPSEGSVSPETIELAARTGFKWAATDEILLGKALGKGFPRDLDGVPGNAAELYTPYVANTPSGPLRMFFRDHHLSDLIGFEYARWDTMDAVNNFIGLVKKIHAKLSSENSIAGRDSYVLPIILDGENAWEYYYDSGRLFLQTLMERMGRLAPEISCVTLSEAANLVDNQPVLPDIPVGSWIDGTFGIWIGHDEDHQAWEALSRARNLLKFHKEQQIVPPSGKEADEIEKAREHLYIAEGSDWCWWYGDDHFTPHGPEFDLLFRHHIKAAYHHMGDNPPDALDIPILNPNKMPTAKNYLSSPLDFIRPHVDGVISSYFEWSSATRYLPAPEFGAMHRAGECFLSAFYYGFDEKTLYFRVDFHSYLHECPVPVFVEFLFPLKNRKIGFGLPPGGGEMTISCGIIGENERTNSGNGVAEGIVAGFEKVLEIGVPFRKLSCEGDPTIEFFISIRPEGAIGERWPMYGTFTAELPGADFRVSMWDV